MKIGIDFDGVITDVGRFKSQAAKRLYGVTIPPRHFRREYVVSKKKIFTERAYRRFLEKIYSTKKFSVFLEPRLNALETIKQWQSAGHEIRIITKRTGRKLEIARSWARDHGMSAQFTGAGYRASKRQATLGLDAYVEDDYAHIEPLIGTVPHLFLLGVGVKKPHVPQAIVHVGSWKMLRAKIKKVERLA